MYECMYVCMYVSKCVWMNINKEPCLRTLVPNSRALVHKHPHQLSPPKYIHTYIHTHTHIHVYDIHTHINRIRENFSHTFKPAFINLFTYIKKVCAFQYIHTYINLYIHSYIHTYIRTYISYTANCLWSNCASLWLARAAASVSWSCT